MWAALVVAIIVGDGSVGEDSERLGEVMISAHETRAQCEAALDELVDRPGARARRRVDVYPPNNRLLVCEVR